MRKNPPVVNSGRSICVVMLRTDEIRRRREALGLTMADAAKLAGFRTAQQWNSVESGWRPNIQASTLYAVAKALRCRMEDLFAPDPLDEPKPRRKPRQK